MLGRAVAPKHTDLLKFYQDNKPAVNWEVMLVLGAIFGAFLAAWQGSELSGEWLPAMWTARFGADSLLIFVPVLIVVLAAVDKFAVR